MIYRVISVSILASRPNWDAWHLIHGLEQIQEMNDNAVKIHKAKKMGIVPADAPETHQMTEREISLFEGDSHLVDDIEGGVK